MVGSGHFLKNHRHLLLVDDIAGGVHVGLGVGEKYRGVDGLDCVGHHPHALSRVFDERHHIG